MQSYMEKAHTRSAMQLMVPTMPITVRILPLKISRKVHFKLKLVLRHVFVLAADVAFISFGAFGLSDWAGDSLSMLLTVKNVTSVHAATVPSATRKKLASYPVFHCGRE